MLQHRVRGGVAVLLPDVRFGEDRIRLRLRVLAARRRLLGQQVGAGLDPVLVALVVTHAVPIPPPGRGVPGERVGPVPDVGYAGGRDAVVSMV